MKNQENNIFRETISQQIRSGYENVERLRITCINSYKENLPKIIINPDEIDENNTLRPLLMIANITMPLFPHSMLYEKIKELKIRDNCTRFLIDGSIIMRELESILINQPMHDPFIFFDPYMVISLILSHLQSKFYSSLFDDKLPKDQIQKNKTIETNHMSITFYNTDRRVSNEHRKYNKTSTETINKSGGKELFDEIHKELKGYYKMIGITNINIHMLVKGKTEKTILKKIVKELTLNTKHLNSKIPKRTLYLKIFPLFIIICPDRNLLNEQQYSQCDSPPYKSYSEYVEKTIKSLIGL